MSTKWSFWTIAVAVPIVIAFMPVVAFKHQGRTVSQVTVSERNKAAPTANVIGPILSRRRYKVEAVRFYARDESGPDWWGSDEIYAEWGDRMSSFVQATSIHEGVNTGDTVMLGPGERCILPVNGEHDYHHPGPWACSDGGVPGPLEFEVALFEADRGLGGFCPDHSGSISRECYDDDLIDQKTVSFATTELERAMPHVGDTSYRAIAIRTNCGYPESEGGLHACPWGGPDYTFTFQLTRLPDQDLPVHP